MHAQSTSPDADRSTQTLLEHSPTDRIEKLAQQHLRDSDYFVLRNVNCEFTGGVLTLRGSLPSWHMKQMAQAIVASLEAIEQVDNRIVVQSYC